MATISITQENTGKWRYRVYYYDNQGIRHAKSKRGYARQAVAKRDAQILASELEQGANMLDREVGFVNYFEEWLTRYKRGKHAKVTENRYDYFKAALKDFFGVAKLKDITLDRWQDFINSYGKTHAKDTVRKINAYVRGMVKAAINNQILNRDFTQGVEFVGKTAKDPGLKFLELPFLKKLKDLVYKTANFQANTSYAIAVGLGTGMRYSEVVGLTWADVDFKNQQLNIDKTWDYHFGQGLMPTKTPSSVRVIDMPDDLTQLLKKLKKEQTEAFMAQGYRDPLNLVFRSTRHLVPTDAATNKMLKSYQTKIQVPAQKQITFHGLRHDHVAYLASQNVDIYYISRRLGHKDVSMTLRIYEHMFKKAEAKQVKKTLKALDNL